MFLFRYLFTCCRFLCKSLSSVCSQPELQCLRQSDVTQVLVSYDLGSARWNTILYYLLIPIQEERQYLTNYITKYLIENNLCFRYEDVWLAIVNWCSADDTRHHVFKELGTRAFKNINIFLRCNTY